MMDEKTRIREMKDKEEAKIRKYVGRQGKRGKDKDKRGWWDEEKAKIR